MTHPTDALVRAAAEKVLLEHAAGRSVDPSRLDWAVGIALTPQGKPIPVIVQKVPT